MYSMVPMTKYYKKITLIFQPETSLHVVVLNLKKSSELLIILVIVNSVREIKYKYKQVLIAYV